MRPTARCAGSLALYLAALAGSAPAQSVRVTVTGQVSGDKVGGFMDAVGDVNGDGVPDFIVGISRCLMPPPAPGRARVHSGADGAVLYELVGDDPDECFGFDVAGLGDVNGDGIPDFAVGAPLDNFTAFRAGSVRVFSGSDGSELYRIHGPRGGPDQPTGSYDLFGSRIAGAGDVDGDGLADIVVGSMGYNGPAGPDTGAAFVYSGADGSRIRAFLGSAAGDELGSGVDGAGDVNGDGFADVVAGARFGTPVPYARVYSGSDGALLHEFLGAASGDALGKEVAGAGDVNADGYDDVVIASPGDQNVPGGYGSVSVFSGFDGAVLLHMEAQLPEERSFGSYVDSAGDVDGDGRPDIVVGVPLFRVPIPGTEALTSGEVIVFSGASGEVVYRVYGDPRPWTGSAFGQRVAGLGDVDGDGLSDVLAAAAGWGGSRGIAHVLSSGVPVATSYCTATPNSTGSPAVMTVWGMNSVTVNGLVLVASQLPALQNGLFIYSPDEASIPLGNGILCLGSRTQGFVNRLPFETSTAAGELLHSLDLTAPPVPGSLITPGSTWSFQAWFRDSHGGGAGFDFSDAVRVTFGP